MPFIGEIFSQLKVAADTTVFQEIRDGNVTGMTGAEFLELISKARTFLASKGLKKGDRCGLLAANSIRWMAVDLAATAEGLIVVPLYFRQAPPELVAMMQDSTPSLVCCGDAGLRDKLLHHLSLMQQRGSQRDGALADIRIALHAGVERSLLRHVSARDRAFGRTPRISPVL